MPLFVVRMFFFPLNTHAEPRFQANGLWARAENADCQDPKKGGALPEVSLKVSHSPILATHRARKVQGAEPVLRSRDWRLPGPPAVVAMVTDAGGPPALSRGRDRG